MIPKTMKASMLTAFNKIELKEVPVPSPGRGEVLCRIKAVAICGTDPEIVKGNHQGKGWPPKLPYVLGHEWAGDVVQVGEGVAGFAVGDRVAGEAHKGCGDCVNCLKGNYTLCMNYGHQESEHRHYGFTTPGANCEYNTYHIKALRKIPDSFQYRHAALLDSAGCALHGIKLIGITPGGTVAVYGPGPIGLCAMQMAKAMGAKTVIMVGRKHRLAVAREIGADYTVDYEKEDPVRRIMEIAGGLGADEVLECSGGEAVPEQSIRCVKKGGRVALIGFYDDTQVNISCMTKVVMDEIMLMGSRANPNTYDEVIRMFEAGAVKGEKIVTHCFPLEDYEKALDTFVNRKDGAIKVVIEP